MNIKNNNIFILFTLSLVIILLCYFVINYAIKIQDKTDDISNIISQVNANEYIKSQLADIKEKRQLYSQEFSTSTSEIKSMFLYQENSGAEYTEFINDLDLLAKEYNLEFDIKYEGDYTSEKNTEEKYLKVSLDLNGRFDDVYKFVYKIENHPYLIDILEYKISKEKESGVSCDLLLKIYVK